MTEDFAVVLCRPGARQDAEKPVSGKGINQHGQVRQKGQSNYQQRPDPNAEGLSAVGRGFRPGRVTARHDGYGRGMERQLEAEVKALF